MSVWFPLHNHSHFSLLDGLSKPEQIAERVAECGYSGAALTDHGVISGVPALLKAMAKKKLKGIAGCEFYVCQDHATVKPQGQGDKTNSALAHLCVLAKGPAGWKNLMRASSASFRPEHSYRKPRLSVEQIGAFGAGEFIAFSGHLGSDLANVCFADPKSAYDVRTYEEARELVHPKWKDRVLEAIAKYQRAFGAENFYLEIQLVDAKHLPAALVVAKILRHCGKLANVKTVATADSHYCRREDAADQRVLLCSAMDTTMKEVQRKLDAAEDVGLGAFFRSNNYHIPSPEEMKELHADHPEELETSLEIAGRCEAFEFGGKPMLPSFPCPAGKSADARLMELCKKGWADKVAGKVRPYEIAVYEERLTREFKVITEAGLSSYFLIVQDYITYATDVLSVKVGKGRGSGAGSLVSYLVGITRVDPIRFQLLFERFYSDGRNTPAHVSFEELPFAKFGQR